MLFGLDEDATNDTYVADVTKRNRIGDRHDITVGGSVRVDRFDITAAPSEHSRTDVAAFAEDRVALGSRIDLVAGGRLDWFDTTGAVFAPRLGVDRADSDRHRARHLQPRIPCAVAAGELRRGRSAGGVPTDPPFFYFQQSRGSTDLRMERQDAFEVGYSRVIGSRAVLFATVYPRP